MRGLLHSGRRCDAFRRNSQPFQRNVLPVVMYGCENWLLTLREERKLRAFENIVLRRIFEPKKDEVAREWRKLLNEELNDLYSSPFVFRVIKSRK
jgi:hypothetical protein